jgi:hypothetical protein
MSLPKAILIFALSAAVCTAGGALIGFCLGRFAPAYYYSVVPPQPGLPYDPVAVGVGLGLTQGLVAGLCVGGVIVLALAIATWRRNNADVPFARRA